MELVARDPVVDTGAAAPDQAPSLAPGRGEPGFLERLVKRQPGLQPGRRDPDRRQGGAGAALLEGAASGPCGLPRGLGAVAERGRPIGQDLLGLVDARSYQALQAGDLVQGQIGEEPEEAPGIGVVDVAPELPIVPGRTHVRVQPYRARRRLAHLGARRRHDQRRGEAEQPGIGQAPAQLHAVDDVAPLVGATHLQRAAMAPIQLDEIIGLENRVVELQEGERLSALQAQPRGIHGEHAVDREVTADIAQEGNVGEPRQPGIVVHHDGVARAVAEAEESLEDAADAGHVGGDPLAVEQRTRLVPKRRVADPGRAPAHQDDRAMAVALQPPQHHDRDQMADMEARRGAVIADIGRDHACRGAAVQRFEVGALMDEAARGHVAQKLGAELGHGGGRGRDAAPWPRRCLLRLHGLVPYARVPSGAPRRRERPVACPFRSRQ